MSSCYVRESEVWYGVYFQIVPRFEINFATMYVLFQAPMSECWDQMMVGMKVEVLNQDSDLQNQVFWIATVIKIAGSALVLHITFITRERDVAPW